jgi:hypothetical protein
MRKLLIGVTLLGVAIAIVPNLPDIKRYLRMRNM